MIFVPVKYKLNSGLLEPECDLWNQLAREWQNGGFKDTFFKASACSSRRLDDETLGSNTTNRVLVDIVDPQGALSDIYTDKFKPLKDIQNALAVFKSTEEIIKTAWLGGVREAVVVVEEVVDLYQDVMDTLGSVLQTVLGPVLDIMGTVIDKVRSKS